jgi:hypothetical protein
VFSPIYEMNMPGSYATVPGRVSAAQAIWLAALAVGAVLLFASRGWRLRVAAVLPVVLGATLAIAAMPHGKQVVIDAVDPVAQELVCARGEPQVCVSRVHSGLLSELAPRAREGLTILAKLPGAPTAVHEDTTTYGPMVYAPWHDDVVLLTVEADTRIEVADVVAGGFASPPECDHFAGPAARLAAAYWLIGKEPVARGTYDPAAIVTAVELWNGLRQLPEGEAKTRVAALRQAALDCKVEEGQLSR